MAPSEDEVEEEVVKSLVPPPQPATKSRPKPRPTYKGRKDAPSDSEEVKPTRSGPVRSAHETIAMLKSPWYIGDNNGEEKGTRRERRGGY